MQAQTDFLLSSVKLIEYIFSPDSVRYNPCVGPLPRNKITFFLLSVFVDDFISTPKIITFLPVSPLGGEKIHAYQIQFHIQNIYNY